MANIEAYCDSEDEVFFGPVTEKERKIADNLRKRAMLSQGFRSPTSARDSQEGEEGLHTLAMAAQMLSLSSFNNGEHLEEAINYQAEKSKQNECYTVLPPVDTITRGITLNTNEGSHLELDAVKFLSRHFPEQNRSGFFEDNKTSFHDTSNIHDTSMVSCTDNEGDELNYWSNSSNLNHMINFHKCENEAEKQMNDLVSSEAHISNVEVTYPKEETKASAITPEIDNKFGMLDVKVNCMDWEDANEISKGDFGIKLSDIEEEMEKVERNLKVEEIIKFLADEDDKSKVKILSEAEVKQSSAAGLSDSKILMFSSLDKVDGYTGLEQLPHGMHKELNDECESKSTLNAHNIRLGMPKVEILPEKVKAEEECDTVNEVISDNVSENYMERKVDILPEEDNTEEKESEKVNDVTGDKSLVETMKDEDIKAHKLNCLSHNEENLESFKVHTTNVSISSDSTRKSRMESTLKKPLPNYLRIPTPKVTPGMEKRPATPRPTRTPNTYTELGKSQSTSRPLRPLQSPALGSASSKSCARSLLQETTSQQAESTPFKTPNAKVKPAVRSKIPHLCPFTPSPNKNKKFAGIVSPVSQYIHSKPVVLIANKKPTTATVNTRNISIDVENKSPKTSDNVTQKSLPDMLGERGAENVDVTNYSTLPEVNFKSGLPVKIFSQISSPKTPKTGKTAIVTKHLGHVKISSIESGKTVPPLSLECRESILQDGEVSLLLSKEVELHCPALLRN